MPSSCVGILLTTHGPTDTSSSPLPIAAIRPAGTATPYPTCPARPVFRSDIVSHLGTSCRRGVSPFNNYVTMAGTVVKICSWVVDTGRLDPIDMEYLISDDTMTTFHRGMRTDEVLLRRRVATSRA